MQGVVKNSLATSQQTPKYKQNPECNLTNKPSCGAAKTATPTQRDKPRDVDLLIKKGTAATGRLVCWMEDGLLCLRFGGGVFLVDGFYALVDDGLDFGVCFLALGVLEELFGGGEAVFAEEFGEFAAAFFEEAEVSGQHADEV
jgi:hypothetical protein